MILARFWEERQLCSWSGLAARLWRSFPYAGENNIWVNRRPG